MPVTALEPDPTIEVLFKGVIVTFIKDGETLAQVGAIHDEPCHEPRITVFEISPAGRKLIASRAMFNLDEDIFLDVENTSRSKIEILSKPGFDRNVKPQDEKDDFGYFVDFKRDIFPTTGLTIDNSKIKPVFHIRNNAVFYTTIPTKTKVQTLRKNGDIKKLGFAAEQIGAQIKFDKLHSRAVLRNGNNVILTIDSRAVLDRKKYIIDFDCECPPPNPPVKRETSDFLLIYKATDLPEDQQVDILGEPQTTGGPSNPQVYCTGGGGGKPLSP